MFYNNPLYLIQNILLTHKQIIFQYTIPQALAIIILLFVSTDLTPLYIHVTYAKHYESPCYWLLSVS